MTEPDNEGRLRFVDGLLASAIGRDIGEMTDRHRQTTADLLGQMLAVEALVGQDTNLTALERILDMEPVVLRAGLELAALNADKRIRVRRERVARARPTLGPREAEALMEGITVGVEFAAAALRLQGRLAR